MLSYPLNTIVASRALVDAAELLCTQTVFRYASNGSYSDDGFRDPSAFLQLRARTSKNEGNARQKRGGLLDRLPLFGAAALAGTITSTHVVFLTSVVTAARLELACRDEEVLLGAATELDASGFQKVLQRWAALCDDELGDPTSDDERDAKRTLQIRQLLNGMWNISGMLDPLTGMAVERAMTVHPQPGNDRMCR